MATKDYDILFSTQDYLKSCFANPKADPVIQNSLIEFHKFWAGISDVKSKVLEFGGGPSIGCLVSACPHVNSITFCEYLPSNREAISSWRENREDAFDWRNTCEYIVAELEDKSKEDAAKREDELRQKIGAILPCDLRKETIVEFPQDLPDDLAPPFDVVSTSLCLEAVVESGEEYQQAVGKLVSLIKPGGYLAIFGVLQCSFYLVGEKVRFYVFPLTKEMILESMENAGLEQIKFKHLDTHCPHISDHVGCFFVSGRVSSH